MGRGEKDQFELFSPDSRQLATSHRDGTIRIYDLATGRVGRTLSLGDHCTRYAFHPNGQQIAVAQASKVQVWDLVTGQATHEFAFGGAVHLAWDPDGRVIATASNNEIHLWNANTGAVMHRSPLSHRGGGILLAFDPSGEILYSGSHWFGTSRLWHVQTGRLLLSDLSFRWPDLFRTTGYLHSDSFNELWEVATGREYRTLARAQDESQFPSIHPGGRLLAVGMSDGVSLWDLDRGAELSPLRIGQVRKPSFGASGDLLAYGDAGLLRWRVQTDADGKIRVGPFERMASSSLRHHDLWSAEDLKAQVVVRANHDGAIVLRRDRPSQPLWLGPHPNCRYVAVSPDGRWIATGAHEGNAKIWDAETGRFVRELSKLSYGRVVFSPDNRWLSSGGIFWAVGTWERGPRFSGDGASFSPDSKMFAVGEQAFIRLIEVETGREVARLEDPNQERTDYSAFSPDGARIVTTNNESGSIHVWDLRLIRRQLEEFGLDWDAPPLPRPSSEAPVAPLQMTVDLGVLDRPTFAKDEPAESIIRKGTEWLAKHPDDGEMRHQRGHALLKVRRFPQAVEDFNAAFRAASDDPHLLAYRGVARFAAGQLDEAIADLEGSLKSKPDQRDISEQLARACNQLARILSLGPEPRRDPARALALARRALELEPDNPPYLQTIGIALCRAGHHADAISFLERSLAIGEDRLKALDLLFLAMARHGLGQSEQASADFDRALRRIQANPPPSTAQAQAMASLRAEAESTLRRPVLTLPTDVFAPVQSEIRP
ncbi:tetratricopeptide repeat protein [Singulisphaera sp. Ch08]|uniref:Tetratricopeptide repeat protein n=1 Tax=Singulisphaera sp. Ch08 TaxID=3120278 RepID=A0AAU7CT17_9BACT